MSVQEKPPETEEPKSTDVGVDNSTKGAENAPEKKEVPPVAQEKQSTPAPRDPKPPSAPVGYGVAAGVEYHDISTHSHISFAEGSCSQPGSPSQVQHVYGTVCLKRNKGGHSVYIYPGDQVVLANYPESVRDRDLFYVAVLTLRGRSPVLLLTEATHSEFWEVDQSTISGVTLGTTPRDVSWVDAVLGSYLQTHHIAQKSGKPLVFRY